MIGLRPILSESQPKTMKNGVRDRERDHDHDLRVDRRHLDGLGQEEQRVELSAVPHDRFAGGGAEQREDRDLGVRPVAEGFLERRLRLLALVLHLLERGRLGELQPDPDRDAEQDHREQERNAPAPVVECGFAHHGADAEDDQQRHEQAERRGGLDPRGVEAALALRRMLGDVGRRAAVLAAEREALHEAEHDQQDRRRDADRRVGRQHADQERADAHQRHGDEEGVLAADEIAETAEHQRAERADRKAGREGEQREDEGRRRRNTGEELAGENRAERAVDVEIVPLEHGAERRREDHGRVALSSDPGSAVVDCGGCHKCP